MAELMVVLSLAGMQHLHEVTMPQYITIPAVITIDWDPARVTSSVA